MSCFRGSAPDGALRLVLFVLIWGSALFAGEATAQEPADPALLVRSSVPFVPPPPTPGEVRSLPPCPAGAEMPAPGEPYTCRPSFETEDLHMGLSFDLGAAYVHGPKPLLGNGIGIGVGLDFSVARELMLGFRYQYLVAGDAGFDGDDDDHFDDVDDPNLGVHLFGAGLRLRLFNDEAGREGWIFEGEGGLALTQDPGLLGPYARVGVGRSIGAFFSPNTGGNFALVLSYAQGFGELADLRAVMLAARLYPEWGIPEPRNMHTRPEEASFLYTFGVRLMLFGGSWGAWEGGGVAPGFGLSFGLPLTMGLEPRASVDLMYLGNNDADMPFLMTGLAGMRFRLTDLLPMYVDVMGGYTLVASTEPRPFDRGAVFDTGLGVYAAGCDGALHVGLHYRAGLSPDNEDMHMIYVAMGGDYGSRDEGEGVTAFGDSTAGCGGWSPGSVDLPPPPPQPATPPPVRTEGGGRLDLDAQMPGVQIPGVQIPGVQIPGVEVEVRVEPIRVEISLGLSFGGFLRAQISPSVLPLAQLREAGFVTVEIIGPPDALLRAQADLRAALGPDGARISGFALVPAPDRVDLRAVFTIWPAGTRPPP